MENLNLIENQAEWLKSFSSGECKSLSAFIIEKAIISCPDFNSFDKEIVFIPIEQEPAIVNNMSVYPSCSKVDKLKIIAFRKNHKFKVWEYDSDNF
jgi:hypothetical protein